MPVSSRPLRFDFASGELDSCLAWKNPPPVWRLAGGLAVEPAERTDFWARTHYGFSASNGHFLALPMEGAFRLATEVVLEPSHRYDQAGLMLWFSENCWMKTSVEFIPGEPNKLGAVVTNGGYSDWSTQNVPAESREFRFEVDYHDGDCLVRAAVAGTPLVQIRLAHQHEFRPGQTVQAGLYACSPEQAGFRVLFRLLEVTPLPPGQP